MPFVRLSLSLIIAALAVLGSPRTSHAADDQDPNAHILIRTFILKETVDPGAPGFDRNDRNNYVEVTNDDVLEGE